MTYIHTKDTDRFYNIERGGRVRVTTREGQVDVLNLVSIVVVGYGYC